MNLTEALQKLKTKKINFNRNCDHASLRSQQKF